MQPEHTCQCCRILLCTCTFRQGRSKFFLAGRQPLESVFVAHCRFVYSLQTTFKLVCALSLQLHLRMTAKAVQLFADQFAETAGSRRNLDARYCRSGKVTSRRKIGVSSSPL